EGGDVDEIARHRCAARAETGDAADIDRAHRRGLQPRRRGVRAGLDAEALAEIAAGAAGDKGEHRVGVDRAAGAEHAVDGLVDRAVAADRDDLLVAFAQRLAHEVGDVAAARAEADRQPRIDAAQRGFDRLRFAPRPAVAGPR